MSKQHAQAAKPIDDIYRCSWMTGYLDVMRSIASHIRAKEFTAAERAFERFMADSRREAAKPETKPRLEYSTPIGDVFSERLSCALERSGYAVLGSVVAATDEELLAVPGVGPLAVAEIRKLAPKPVRQTVHSYLAGS